MARTISSVLVATLVFAVNTVWGAGVPQAVSPGSAQGVALVADACPTFSWGAVPGATGYEIVVYWADEDDEAAEPLLKHRIAGPALSWTPTLERCLPRGGRYAWSVSALGTGDKPEWSAANLFGLLPLQVISEDLEVQGKLTVNPGAGFVAEIELEDPQGQTWQINTVADDFTIQDVDAGLDVFWIEDGAPFASIVVEDTGRVLIGYDATIEGDVAMGSSRELKTDFAPVEAAGVLAKLVHLPIQVWRFKEDARQARHIGPMAEDFFEAFGLGRDDKHISPGDAAGIGLAAIQALHVENAELRRELQRLEARMEQGKGLQGAGGIGTGFMH